jgi:hypothetical protein
MLSRAAPRERCIDQSPGGDRWIARLQKLG